MTTINTLSDLPTLNCEIAACKQAQSWSPNSIRTSWVGSLEAIRDATTDENLAAAITAAATEARRLATICAHILGDPDEIRERLYADLTAEQDDEIRDMTVAQLVAWMRENDVTIDDATNGKRHDPADGTPAIQEFHPDGTPKWVEHWTNGKYHDPDDGTPALQKFYPDGTPKVVEHYTNGKYHDPDDGTPARQGFYPDGSPEWIGHHTNGKFVGEESFPPPIGEA